MSWVENLITVLVQEPHQVVEIEDVKSQEENPEENPEENLVKREDVSTREDVVVKEDDK
jgi:hypothetical protein|uniref:Uncharacterized protein n=1 Tax=viral metagenome TaxID=1070528 RepID=A0A6C0IPA4_9ZZZZ